MSILKDNELSGIPDRPQTIKYLEDLNERLQETPFIALGNNYLEQLKATLNYSPTLKVRKFKPIQLNWESVGLEPVKRDLFVIAEFKVKIPIFNDENEEVETINELLLTKTFPYPQILFAEEIQATVIDNNLKLSSLGGKISYTSINFYPSSDGENKLTVDNEDVVIFKFTGEDLYIPMDTLKSRYVSVTFEVTDNIPVIEIPPQKEEYLIFEVTHDVEDSNILPLKKVYSTNYIENSVNSTDMCVWRIANSLINFSFNRVDRLKEHNITLHIYHSDDGENKLENITEFHVMDSPSISLITFEQIKNKHFKYTHHFPEVQQYIYYSEKVNMITFIPENGNYTPFALLTGIGKEHKSLKVVGKDDGIPTNSVNGYRWHFYKYDKNDPLVYTKNILPNFDLTINPFSTNNIELLWSNVLEPLIAKLHDVCSSYPLMTFNDGSARSTDYDFLGIGIGINNYNYWKRPSGVIAQEVNNTLNKQALLERYSLERTEEFTGAYTVNQRTQLTPPENTTKYISDSYSGKEYPPSKWGQEIRKPFTLSLHAVFNVRYQRSTGGYVRTESKELLQLMTELHRIFTIYPDGHKSVFTDVQDNYINIQNERIIND